MATTFRDLINRVLRPLSETEVSGTALTLESQYHKLIATFVNQIKEEVEDAHNWRRLQQTISVTVTAGSATGVITGTNDRSRLYREYDEVSGIERPLVVDTTTSDGEFAVQEIDLARIKYLEEVTSVNSAQYATQFAIDDTTDEDEVLLHVYPIPQTTRTYMVTMIVPQPRIADTALTTVITIPVRAIEMGALWYALEERGEELGVNAVFSEKKYRIALDDSISRDAAEQGGYNLVPV